MSDRDQRDGGADGQGLEDWRRLIEKALRGRGFSVLRSGTRDGIVIEPLYRAASEAVPIAARGAVPWTIVQILDHADADAANAQALEDVAGGATGLSLRFSGAPSAGDTGLPPTAEDLSISLEGIDPAATALRLDPHPEQPRIARLLRDLVLKQGLAPESAQIAFGLDPISAIAMDGGAAGIDAENFVSCFQELRAGQFSGPLAALDARTFHEAGGSEAQELAAILGAAAWWLRALDRAGLPPRACLPCFGVTLTTDRDQFLSIAKFRALRLLWARLQELCATPPSPLPVHAETGRRMMTRADPHTNLLRTTIAAFAAGIGGADSIAVLPHDAALGPADRNARALARNLQHLLMEESHLHRVADPAAGSGAVEALTSALAERAWAEFQTIEGEGGIVESLRSQAFPARIATARDALCSEIASGRTPLVGATVYRLPDEQDQAPVSGEAAPAAGLVPIRLEMLAGAAAR